MNVRNWETEPCERNYKLNHAQSVPYGFTHFHLLASVFTLKHVSINLASSNQIVRTCRQEFYDIFFLNLPHNLVIQSSGG